MRNRKVFTLAQILIALVLFTVLLTVAVAYLYEDEREIDGKKVPCVGAFDERDPKYKYEVSDRNAGIALGLFSTVIAPGYVALKSLYCPVSVK